MYDVFICHASEDKEEVARPLAELLQSAGVEVWYDDFQLQVGDSLSQSIDAGVAQSHFGVAIISRRFFEKPWPRRELDGLVARELASGRKIVLPVWHRISKDEVLAASPPLADVLAATTSKGLTHVAGQILKVVKGPSHLQGGRYELKIHMGNNSCNKINFLSAIEVLRIEGEYLVFGKNADDSGYQGRAIVKVHQGVVIIAAKIGQNTHICQGKIDGNRLRAYGDFDVEYIFLGDGSLTGTWGAGGTETLVPVESANGTIQVKVDKTIAGEGTASLFGEPDEPSS